MRSGIGCRYNNAQNRSLELAIAAEHTYAQLVVPSSITKTLFIANIMSNQQTQAPPQHGDLSWRLSSHPITLLTFLGFRICKVFTSSPP
jgi:hypothetical protein